jgi:N-acetylglucosamine kinase-like BadF-type ATPase
MIIIADSGSSKTDWRLISQHGKIASAQTQGLNPHIISEEIFNSQILHSEIRTWSGRAIDKVYFYGAGITEGYMQDTLYNWIKHYFKKAKILVASDLLGAAIAAYGDEPGIIGILGTGSNSGFFNGTEITSNVPSLGYLLGDEGSGSALGKRLVTLFLRNELSAQQAEDFKLFYPNYKNLLKDIYSESQPSRLLASLVPFIHKNRQAPVINNILRNEFARYFKLLNYYEIKGPVSLIGSVAYYFKDSLQEVAEEQGISLHKIMKSPIEALTLYHQAVNL